MFLNQTDEHMVKGTSIMRTKNRDGAANEAEYAAVQ